VCSQIAAIGSNTILHSTIFYSTVNTQTLNLNSKFWLILSLKLTNRQMIRKKYTNALIWIRAQWIPTLIKAEGTYSVTPTSLIFNDTNSHMSPSANPQSWTTHNWCMPWHTAVHGLTGRCMVPTIWSTNNNPWQSPSTRSKLWPRSAL